MHYKAGDSVAGFTVKRAEHIAEIDSAVYLMEHQILGCPLLAIKNDDPNKTFCIAFHTIPTDSTGVAHILEHAVLSGSVKYPIKDVFGELHRGGLMTFLNAMTGADITYYPFATKNRKEYFNLMDVYCDVVFNPLLTRQTFDQEGYHFHKEAVDQPLAYQGVVYNEMKGAFSDPIRLIFHHLFRGLMPGSTYAFESGGDPAVIPELSYEQFRNFHAAHYHPSNSMIFVYGDAPLEEEVDFLHANYLNRFAEKEQRRTIDPGTIITEPVLIEDRYGVETTDTANKTYLAVGTLVGTVSQRERNAALQVIANILYNSDGSPLKKRIMESGICQDFGGLYLSSSSFNTLMITYLVGSEPDYLERFTEIYQQALTEIAQNGIDQELVLAELNKFEFTVREEAGKAQRGLDLMGKAQTALKYGNDPFAALTIDELLRSIRAKALNERYFETLIQQSLLNNKAQATVTLIPDPDKPRQIAATEQRALKNYEKTLSEKDIEQLISYTEELLAHQRQPNSKADLALLPSLRRSDLPPSVEYQEAQSQEMFNSQVLVNELPTRRISYLDVGLDFSRVPPRLLPLLDLFGVIITEIGTSRLDYMAFAKKAATVTGGLSHAINTYTHRGAPDQVRCVLWLSLKALPEYLEQAVDLLAEVLADVSLANRLRIKEIVQREYAWAEHGAQSEGYQLASHRVFSHLSIAGRYQELCNGITAHRYLKTLATDYDRYENDFLADLQSMAELLFTRDNLIFALTAEQPEITRFASLGDRLTGALAAGGDLPVFLPDEGGFPRHEAFVTAAEIVYNVQGGVLFDGDGYHGSFEVLKAYLSRDYLWNTVRQIGGAYGCFIQFSHITGNCAVISYRDPHVRKTYDAYGAMADITADLELSDQALEQLIVGAYGALNPHQSVAARGATARNEFLNGIDRNHKQARLNEVVAATPAELRGFADYFHSFQQRCFRATIGNRKKIDTDKDLFARISEL
jgi:Zn-dependent M16 (insulinase) family peptidase